MATLGSTGVDEEAAILLRHAGGQLSVLSCSLRVDTPREARILGTGGSITLCRPWWGASRIVVQTRAGRDEVIELPHRGGGYTHEAEAFMELMRAGAAASAVMPLDESLAIMRTMDGLRAAWGLRYPGE